MLLNAQDMTRSCNDDSTETGLVLASLHHAQALDSTINAIVRDKSDAIDEAGTSCGLRLPTNEL